MSYCLNPACTSPENADALKFCQSCGSQLLLRDRYQASRILGRGGFGTTFLAVDQGLPGQPTCVIKQLRPVVTAPHILEMARSLFQREATTLGKIGNHPQLPRLLDYFELEQEFYLIQEYVSGATLQQEVKRSGPLSEAATKQVLREVLPILDYLHGNEVIHRDIKPANLIRRNIDNRFVLIDFGAVKDQVNQAMADNPEEHSTLTAFAVGTPGFAPPEQMAMRPVYSSDLYALGVTCLYLLTGKSPKDLNYDPVTGELLWRDFVKVSSHFSSILTKMLEVSVRHRYQSAAEILRILDLESHAQQLSQGIGSPPGESSGSAFVNPRVSPVSRSAVAIRSQQARLEASGLTRITPHQPPAARPGATPGTRTTLRQGAIATTAVPQREHLDALQLVTAYNRGRRDFTNLVLPNLVLRKANLVESIFHQAQLANADLRGANLYNVNFGRANLNKANLKDCNLARAYLSFADLEGADLRGADLTHASLSNANLRGANLCGANLTGATISEEQLAQARTNWSTTLPHGRRAR